MTATKKAVKTDNIYDKLTRMQSSISVPKNRYNKFGGFSYRSIDDILEAIKPKLDVWGLSIILADDVALIGDRYYIKATATLIDNATKETITASAFAREQDIKKGMDLSQLTGSTSSYARKYALNGLLLLDDNKDPDSSEGNDENNDDVPTHPVPKKSFTTETIPNPIKNKEQKPKQSNKDFDKQAFLKQCRTIIAKKELSEKVVDGILAMQGLKSLEDVESKTEAIDIYKILKSTVKEVDNGSKS